jgi:carboxylesterase
MPGGEPFFFSGGSCAFLLIHGFTGTPREMRWLGEQLAARGHTVLGVRLAGHATTPQDLIRTRWQDWLASVVDGYEILRGHTDRVVVGGLSLGGTLALLFGTLFPVAGVISMSGLVRLPNPWAGRLHPLIPLVSLFLTHIGKGPPDWRDPEAGIGHLEYPKYPIRPVAELVDLSALTRSRLAGLAAPLLIIHSHQDGSIPAEQAEEISRLAGSSQKRILWLENSGHVVTRDADRQLVLEACDAFGKQVTQVSLDRARA